MEDFEIVEMYCMRCKNKIDKPSDFRTPEHFRTYMMTGMCQACQDLEARKDRRLREIEHGRR